MTDKDRWIQDALDAWLSPELGTGPKGDEGWRERTGYFQSPFQAGDGGPAAPSDPPAAPGADPPPGSSWLADGYEEQRTALRTAMTGFMNRMMYFFPDRNAMTIDDLAAAAGLIAEQERQVRVAGGWAILHKVKGRPELGREVDAGLAELASLKQAYALQRRAIEQREAARIQEINRDRDAFVREQDEKRREMALQTDRDIAALREKSRKEQAEADDRRHAEVIRYLRDEPVFEIREL